MKSHSKIILLTWCFTVFCLSLLMPQAYGANAAGVTIQSYRIPNTSHTVEIITPHFSPAARAAQAKKTALQQEVQHLKQQNAIMAANLANLSTLVVANRAPCPVPILPLYILDRPAYFYSSVTLPTTITGTGTGTGGTIPGVSPTTPTGQLDTDLIGTPSPSPRYQVQATPLISAVTPVQTSFPQVFSIPGGGPLSQFGASSVFTIPGTSPGANIFSPATGVRVFSSTPGSLR